MNKEKDSIPIVIIGMSGSGKSTYAKRLEEKLQSQSVDLDAYIEAHEQKKISQIFAEQGESYFRDLEWRLFEDLLGQKVKIIATGAGMVPTAVNRGIQKPANGFFCFINPPIDVIVMNLSKPEELAKRPLLRDLEDIRAAVEKQAENRMSAYLLWADEVISSF